MPPDWYKLDTQHRATEDRCLYYILFPLYSSELQLKVRHQPYKLCRQWQDLLYRFTEASEEDISQGESLVSILLGLYTQEMKGVKRRDLVTDSLGNSVITVWLIITQHAFKSPPSNKVPLLQNT